MSEVRAKPHRLPLGAYHGQRNIAFTATVQGRKPLFKDQNVVSELTAILAEQTADHDCLVGIYCFMPDHLHAILCGQTERANGKRAFDAFKHKSGLWLAQNQPDYAWQQDYYDHIIRRGDDWRRQAMYIYRNPVRKGLVADAANYPGTGSIGYDLTELLIDATY